jgi:excisionase family DNA binding protein
MTDDRIVLSLVGGVTLSFPVDTPPDTVRAHARELAGEVSPKDTRATHSPYLTTDEAAEYLRFPKKRIFNLKSRSAIPYRKQDGRLLFHRDELDRWMDQFYAGPEWAGPAGGDVV